MTIARILATKGREVIAAQPHRTLLEISEILAELPHRRRGDRRRTRQPARNFVGARHRARDRPAWRPGSGRSGLVTHDERGCHHRRGGDLARDGRADEPRPLPPHSGFERRPVERPHLDRRCGQVPACGNGARAVGAARIYHDGLVPPFG